MEKIKSFTDIEQSTKLAEILPIESADMYWWYSGRRYYIEAMNDGDFNENSDIRAWSLATLFNMIPTVYMASLEKCSDGTFLAHLDDMEEHDCYADNPIDACYEMIIKLNERKIL